MEKGNIDYTKDRLFKAFKDDMTGMLIVEVKRDGNIEGNMLTHLSQDAVGYWPLNTDKPLVFKWLNDEKTIIFLGKQSMGKYHSDRPLRVNVYEGDDLNILTTGEGATLLIEEHVFTDQEKEYFNQNLYYYPDGEAAKNLAEVMFNTYGEMSLEDWELFVAQLVHYVW